MWLIDVIRYRWRVLTKPRAHETELADELAFHQELEAQQQRHAATAELSLRDARFAARRRFGNATYYKEETRRVSGIVFFDTLLQDARFALRSFARTPMFTLIAVLTLAIGIGANTAIFSTVDALILRPLPFFEPDRLLSVHLEAPIPGGSAEQRERPWSYPKFEALRSAPAAQSVFSSLTLWRGSQFTVSATNEADRVSGEFTDAAYLATLGIAPELGRYFSANEDHFGDASRVAVISDDLWRDLYSADPNVAGRRIDVDGFPYTIVGVAPAGFHGLSGQSAVWMPIVSSPAGWNVNDPWSHNYFAVARLANGVTAARAESIVREIGRRIDAQFPNPQPANVHWAAVAHQLDAARVDGRTRTTLFILFAAVGLVLLIACANVANLFLVRASARHREIAVRLAIGASRWRIIRQLLVESTLLALVGGLASLVVAWVGVRAIAATQPATTLRMDTIAGLGIVNFARIGLDVRAFGFATAVALATGILFGLVPAIQATRPSLTAGLKDDGGGRPAVLRGLTSRNVLTVAEIALAVVLLAGSGLLLRSLSHLLELSPGFSPEHVLTMRVNRAPAWSRDSITRFYDVAIERLRRIPGVTDVAIADCPPLGGWCSGGPVRFPDRAPVAPGMEPGAGSHWITPNWPSVVGMPLLRGRMLERTDVQTSRKVVLVSETAARRFWPNQDPIGRPMQFNGPDTAYVVGVVGDIAYGEIDSLPRPEVYVSYYQAPLSYRMMLFVRTHGDPLAAANPSRQALREVAPGFPMYDVRLLAYQVRDATAYARVSAVMLALFAAIALALATMGTYGVISFAVAQRTREIGVRIALGATAGDVLRLVVGQGIVLAAVGIGFGVTAALVVTRVLRSMLIGVEPGDPATLVSIVALLLLAVLLASLIPARRAAGIPPVEALRGG